MQTRWHIDLYLFIACLIGLAAGGALWLAGERPAGGWVWTAAALAIVLPLLYRTARALWRHEFGVDVLALVSIGGALALQQSLTAVVIALMLASGRLLESFAAGRAAREISALLARVPRSAHVYREAGLVEVSLDDVQPGERLLVRQGEVLAVDGVLLSAHAALDESALSGEALPVAHTAGAHLRSGSVNAADAFDLRATARAADSTFAGIVKLVRAAQQSKAPVVRLADRYAAWFVPAAIALAALAWGLSHDALRALAVVVVATPCPLLLAVPVAFVSGISRSARRGILVKGGGALEALAGAKTLFFDKTGTLTGGQAHLAVIEPAEPGRENELLVAAATLEQASNHVIAAALVAAAQTRGLTLKLATDVSEEPGAGLTGSVNGRRVAVGTLAYVARRATLPEALAGRLEHAASAGLSAVLVVIDERYAGMLLLADQIRTDAPRALRLLRRAGMARIVMLTGDRQDVADAIGASLGVDAILAEQTPAQKLAAIEAARAAGASVMVGDGINDAPALAAADVGVAMGARGATASAEAADIVLLVDRVDRLAEALVIARRTRAIALQSALIGMAASALAMIAAALGWLPPLYGALLQEVIDVAVILNALRALAIRPLRAARFSLTPEQARELKDDHARLDPVLDLVASLAARLPTLDAAEQRAALTALDLRLREELLPHERADDREVYPALAELLGGDDPMAAMSRGHREIFRLYRRFSVLLAGLPEVPDAAGVQDLQRTLYAFDAVLRLHFAQEEEIYHSLARA
ncbi:MAG: heavy metal translocating P-type ATPase [Gammaproteobacteria bacterium]